MARLIQVGGRWLTPDQVRGTRQWQTVREPVIAAADGGRCPECGRTMRRGHPVHARWPTADHVVPLEAGGAPFDPANLVALCHGCNSAKSDRRRHPIELHADSW